MDLANFISTNLNTIVTIVAIIIALSSLSAKYIKSRKTHKTVIKKSTINGDVVSGDIFNGNKFEFNNCTVNIADNYNDNSITSIMEKKFNHLSLNSQQIIRDFKYLNPSLDLIITQSNIRTDYIIKSVSKESIPIGIINFKGDGIEKYHKHIEEGIDIILLENEYDFKNNIRGLPDFDKSSLKQQLILKTNIQKIYPIKLLLYDKKNNKCFEIITNLTILNSGTKITNCLIHGLEFLGNFSFKINISNNIILDVKLNFDYNTIEFENLLKTHQFLLFLKQLPILKICLIESNKQILKIEVNHINFPVDLNQNINFLIKYINVINHYQLKPIELFKLSQNNSILIEIIDSFINNTAISFYKYKLRIASHNQDENQFNNLISNVKSNIYLKFDIHLLFELLNTKIDLGSNKLYVYNPKIKKIDNSTSIEIEYEKIIFDFSK